MGGGQKAPTPYQPAHQGAADSAYYGTLSGLTSQDQANMGAVDTGYANAYNGVLANQYAQPMVQGTVNAANVTNQVGQNDVTQGGLVTAQGNQIFNDAGTVRGYAPQLEQLAGLAKGYAAPMAANADTLRSYAPYLAEMGLDPNFSEYNYGMQQTKDAANVGNAEQGLSGSPFAAGVTGDAMAAYKRNYDASRLTKGMQALSALSGLYGSAGGLDLNALTALQGSGGLLNDAAGMYGKAANMGITGSNIVTAGQGLQGQGADTQALAAMMPYEASNTISQDQMAALGQMAQGESAMSGNLQNDVSGYGNYLNIGQQATAGAQNAAKINYQDSFMGGLGQLLGVAVQAGMHFIPGG